MAKRFAIILICICLIATGCSGSDSGSSAAILLSVDKTKVSLGEAMLYVMGQKTLIEDSYGDRIWTVDVDGEGFDSLLTDRTKSSIALTYASAALASSRGISLSSDDKTLAVSAANYLYSGLSEATKDKLDLDLEDVENAYTCYALAKKGYDEMVNAETIEVSQDEARVIVLAQIRVNISGLTEEEKNEKWARINEANEKLQAGEDFLTVAAEYNEDTSIQLTVTRDDLPQSEENVAFSLSKDEISSPKENSDSIFIFKCLNTNEETLSSARRENLLKEKKDQFFMNTMKSFLETHPIKWQDELWASVDITTLSYTSEYNFYDVYDMFFPGG